MDRGIGHPVVPPPLLSSFPCEASTVRNSEHSNTTALMDLVLAFATSSCFGFFSVNETTSIPRLRFRCSSLQQSNTERQGWVKGRSLIEEASNPREEGGLLSQRANSPLSKREQAFLKENFRGAWGGGQGLCTEQSTVTFDTVI